MIRPSLERRAAARGTACRARLRRDAQRPVFAHRGRRAAGRACRRPCRARGSRRARSSSGSTWSSGRNSVISISLGGLRLERLELLGREGDVLALAELVALHDLVARDDLLVLRAPVLLLHARAALVEHVERDPAARFGRGVELDRNRDQAEGDRWQTRSRARPWRNPYASSRERQHVRHRWPGETS